VLEHLKAPLDLHSRLIEDFSNGDPIPSRLTYIVNNLLSRHENDGVEDILAEILKPIIARMWSFKLHNAA
jgi:hypothetical protein